MIKRFFYVLSQNPVFFVKRIFCELRARVAPVPRAGVFNFNDVLFDFDFSFSHKIKKMYFGTFQPIISETLKKYLKKGDTFIDAGANIGYFSFVASQLVGKQGQVHSFEPVPEYFLKLDNFAKINKNYSIKANQIGLGDRAQTAEIFIKGGTDIGNNTFFPELLDKEKSSSSAKVPVIRLDEYIKNNNLKNIKLIKIDVEGFELSVLKGLQNYFEQGNRPVIVCEIVPEVYKNGVKEIFDYMGQFSYQAYDVLNTNKKIQIKNIEKNRVTDVIFKV